MATASANVTKLGDFVSAANDILNGDGGLNGKITSLRANYDAFQAAPKTAGEIGNVDLMDGLPASGGGRDRSEIGRLAYNYNNDRLFVEAVRRAFERASGSHSGNVSVSGYSFDEAFQTTVQDVAREFGIPVADITAWRAPVTVNEPVANGIPQTSGFVNDPICTATGHFLELEEDFTWPDRLGLLRWARVYSSRFISDGPLGRGWASWATVAVLPQGDGTVGYHGPEGQMAIFAPAAEGLGFGRISGIAAELSALPRGNGNGHGNGDGSGGWQMRWEWHSEHPGELWTFAADGLLRTVEGPTTGTTRFVYEATRLQRVEHDSGRSLTLDWDGARIVAVRSSCGRQARYTYNPAGDLVHSERILGDRDYEPDEAGRIVEVRDADGVRLCRNSYDDEGRVLSQITPFGREVVLRYHPGNRTVVTDTTDGPVEVYEHDQAGRLIGLVDHHGHRLDRAFDIEGRCVAATGFDGAAVTQTFADHGETATRLAPDGVAEQWDYDDHHRVTSHRIEHGPELSFEYDGDSPFPSRMTSPDGWEMRVDLVDGQMRSITDADGVSASFDYDTDGNLVATANGLGATTRIEPHVSGQAARIVTADGAVAEFERDPAGRMLGVRTQLGEEFRVEWSPAGRLVGLVEPNGARTSFEPGSHGEIERVVDALGATIELQRDHLARLVGVSVPGGAKWGFSYTAVGLLSMVSDPAGGVWHYDYDPEGRPLTATDPLGEQVRMRYNPAGRLVEFLDRSGNATRYGHDALGRVVRSETGEGAVTTHEWDLWGRPTSVGFPDGGTLTYRYTPAGRVAGVETAEGRGWTNTYDPGGRLVAVTDAAGRTTRFEYDVCDRLVAQVTPSGRTSRYRYDPAGRVVESEIAGRRWRTDYDHAGRIVASSDPLGATTRYEYDLRGKLVASTDPLGNTVRIRYDERGNPAGLLDPFGGLLTTSYDAMRHPAAVTDQLGRTTRMERDPLGRLVRQALPTGDVVEWRRDPRGHATDVRVNGRDVVVFDLDREGRPVVIHEPSRNRTVTLGWSPGGRLRSLDVDGREMRWDRDLDGYVTARHEPGGRVVRIDRDLAGHMASVAIEGWGDIELDHDADGRLVSLRAPGIERRWDHDAAGFVAATHDGDRTTDLVRDETGRVVEMRNGDEVTRYRYDAAGQLVGAVRGSAAWEWLYDPAGRLAREDGPAGSRTFEYDAAHQLVHVDSPAGRTSYAYDAAGRRIEESGPYGTRRYRWNPLGHLTGVDDHQVDVDALGQLAAYGDTTFTWDPTGPVSEPVAIGDHQVVGAGHLVLGLAEPDRTTAWLPGDGRGSTDRGDGRDAWGAGPSHDEPTLGFLGEVEFDGLVWLRNRIYDPETRQFLSPDPLPGVPGLPVAANPYAYANNNPIGFVDPLGLQGQPLSIEQYNEIRAQETGPQWNNIVTVGLVVVGVATMFIPGVNLVGAVLIGAALGAAGGAAPGVINGIQTGQWDWGAIGGGALKGAIIGGATAGFGRGFGNLAGRMGPATGRGAAAFRGAGFGAGEGLTTGTMAELYDLTPLPGSDGQFDPEGVAISTVTGGVFGGGLGAATHRPPGLAEPPANPSAYSVAYEVELDPSVWGRSRSVHFNRSNMALDNAMQSDPQFAAAMEDISPGVGTNVARAGGREDPPGMTWHHTHSSTVGGRQGVMHLVPTSQHEPGSAWQHVLHPGGGGGYAEWAIPNGAPPNR